MIRNIRQIAFFLLLCSHLAGILACSQHQAARWSGPFFFIQMADPQFGMFAKNEHFDKETDLFEQAVAHANRLKPAFVVICGDLTNRAGNPAQIAELLRIADKLDKDIPLYLVAGNHDVEKEPTPQSLQQYRESLGKDWYSFRHGGCKFIVLNSAIIQGPDKVKDQLQQQRKWLERELASAKDNQPAHIILFQHHPWFVKDRQEQDGYHNIPRPRRDNYLALLDEAGVAAVFTGHLHKNKYARFGNMEMICSGPVGRPLGEDPSGFRIVKVYRDRIEHHYHGLHDMPQTVDLKERPSIMVGK